MTYAIVSIGGKQYRVHEGERLLVDRLPYEAGKTFTPDVLMLGGDGDPKLGEGEVKGQEVKALVAAHVLGDKVIVGKHRRRTGYRRRKGHRSRLSQIEIRSIGTKKASRPRTAKKTEGTARKTEGTARKTATAKKTDTTAKTEKK
jgi:large subunit ribosomal protein L21